MQTSTNQQVSKQAPVRGILSLAVVANIGTIASTCGAFLQRGEHASWGMVGGSKRTTGTTGSTGLAGSNPVSKPGNFLQNNRISRNSRTTRIRGPQPW